MAPLHTAHCGLEGHACALQEPIHASSITVTATLGTIIDDCCSLRSKIFLKKIIGGFVFLHQIYYTSCRHSDILIYTLRILTIIIVMM